LTVVARSPILNPIIDASFCCGSLGDLRHVVLERPTRFRLLLLVALGSTSGEGHEAATATAAWAALALIDSSIIRCRPRASQLGA
jgi:hypothetical protein